MENLFDIYKEAYNVENVENSRINNIDKISLFSKKRKIGEIFLPSSYLSILIIIPGAGFNEKNKDNIFKQFKFLLKNKIAICIFDLTEANLNKKDKEFFYFFKERVAEIKGIIRFIEDNLQIKNINLMGISLGGIIGFVISGIVKEIKKCIFLISGANLELITWRSLLRFYLKKDCSRKACRQMHKIYRKFMEKKLYNEIENLPRKCFFYEPLTYIEKLKNIDILMINGMFDMIVPFYCAFEIKKKLKRLKILWYPGTHLTYRFFHPIFKKKILNFIKNGYPIRH
ncbi:MAG: hypothetical protein NC915_04785 [Candidatus Omnitrophica bacterium]|nr:hypothetical protein [Candidatus Omnitrophota bacterium]